MPDMLSATLLLAVATFLPTDAKLARELTGTYQIAADHIVDIGPFSELGGDLAFLDEKTMREGRLRQVSATEFTAGATLGADEPVAIRATVVRNERGEVIALKWSGDGVDEVTAKKIAPHTTEAVEIHNGDVTLRGILAVPSSKGPHPAIVFAPGSGKTMRDVGPWNPFFVRLGIAVLSLDKRGVGESTGDFKTSSMDDLVGDLLAGVEFLAKRNDIDAKRIGVHGSSQGGWTAPLMAKRSKRIAYVIVRAGSGTTVSDTMAHEHMWQMREDGVPADEASEAELAARKIFGAAAHGGAAKDLEGAIAPYRDRPWFKKTWLGELTETDPDVKWLRLNGQYDSSVTLRDVRVPVLWFLGDLDHNVPSAVSEVKLKQAKAASKNRDFTIRIVPHAGHAFLETTTGDNKEFPTLSHASRGYWEVMAEWLKKRGYSR
jgi:uncharacterized protein